MNFVFNAKGVKVQEVKAPEDKDEYDANKQGAKN